MKKILIFAAVLACMLAASSVQAALNLVTDGDFEDLNEVGILSLQPTSNPWFTDTSFSDFAHAYVAIVDDGIAHKGNYAAALYTYQNPEPSLEQSITLVPGEQTTVSFWAMPTAKGSFGASINGVQLTPITFDNPTQYGQYEQYNYTITPASAAGDLIFSWDSGVGATMYIDDVIVTQVPEPTTLVAGALLLLPFGASTLRMVRKRQAA